MTTIKMTNPNPADFDIWFQLLISKLESQLYINKWIQRDDLYTFYCRSGTCSTSLSLFSRMLGQQIATNDRFFLARQNIASSDNKRSKCSFYIYTSTSLMLNRIINFNDYTFKR